MGGANGSRECAPDDKLRDTHQLHFVEVRGFAGLNPCCGLTTKPAQVICPSGGLLTGVSSPICKNISVFTYPKSLLELFASHPKRGAYHDRHERRGGMRWTRQRFARDGIAGLVERLVSDHRRADERCCCGRQNRVVLTPRRWRQVRGGLLARPGS